MTITLGQPTDPADFVSSSAGAGHAGKVPKLNASGRLSDTFIPSQPYTSGVASRAFIAASGSQVIPHGLGAVPTFIRIHALVTSSSVYAQSIGTYNGTTRANINSTQDDGGSGDTAGNDTTNVIYLNELSGNTNVATVTFDATNITLSWTHGGSGAGTIQILWEAFR